jgi:hypothetical protein
LRLQSLRRCLVAAMHLHSATSQQRIWYRQVLVGKHITTPKLAYSTSLATGRFCDTKMHCQHQHLPPLAVVPHIVTCHAAVLDLMHTAQLTSVDYDVKCM